MKKPRLVPIPPELRRPDLVRRLPRNANFRDRTGEKLNGCAVLGYAGILPPSFSAWLCRCQCGRRFIAPSAHLNHPTATCGCGKLKHGLSNTPLYNVWREMIARCYHPRHKSYRLEGGQGVAVCRRWRDSIRQFARDVGPRPTPAHAFARLNPKRDYSPANCAWITKAQRRASGSRRIFIEHDGERLALGEWAQRLGLTRQAVGYRVQRCKKLGLNSALAVTTPAGVHLRRAAQSTGR